MPSKTPTSSTKMSPLFQSQEEVSVGDIDTPAAGTSSASQVWIISEGSRTMNYYVLKAKLARTASLFPKAQSLLVKDIDPNIRVYVAANPSLLPAFQYSLLTDYYSVRQALAGNASISQKAQNVLAKDYDFSVRSRLAENQSISPKTQALLALDYNFEVRRNLAAWATSIKAQMLLAKDKSVDVRCALAENHSLLQEVYIQLAKDRSHNVKYALSKNPSLPLKSQLLLANGKVAHAHYGLAMNPSLKLQPAIVLYYSNNEFLRDNLHIYNPYLCHTIEKLEKNILKPLSASFVRLAKSSQQNAVLKKIMTSHLESIV